MISYLFSFVMLYNNVTNGRIDYKIFLTMHFQTNENIQTVQIRVFDFPITIGSSQFLVIHLFGIENILRFTISKFV